MAEKLLDVAGFDDLIDAYQCAQKSDALDERAEARAAHSNPQEVDAKENLQARIETARKAGLQLRIDSKFGSDHYHSVTGSWPALIRFASLLPATLQTAQLSAAYAALDAVTGWAQNERSDAGVRLLALLLKNGVHPRTGEQS